jgi:NhaA family Na+:H+ antiporter
MPTPPRHRPTLADRRAAARPWRAETWGDALRRLVALEAGGAVILCAAVVAALFWANLAAGSYVAFWFHPLDWFPSGSGIDDNLQGLLNSGLMTVFFLAIGLEIGRERATGSLSENANAVMPVVAALGGMAGAAGVYLLVGPGPGAEGGWGVPMATDVAFTLGLLALLGRRIPSGLRVFVLTLAIADDVASVVVLAVISSSNIHVWPLVGASAVLAAVAVARRRSGQWWVYLAAACVMWFLLAEGGVEPTLAGAFVGMLVPTAALFGSDPSGRLEAVSNPASTYFVLPLFALANTGVLIGSHLHTEHQLIVAIVSARLLGKMLGITLATAIVVWFGVARLPEGVSWPMLVGTSAACGMGFTVPLLFAQRAFNEKPSLLAGAQVGLLVASGVAFLIGGAILLISTSGARGNRTVGD